MGMPAVFTDKLMLRIQCRDHESVPYGVFCRGVVSCLVLKDFCQQLKSLYKMLDVLHEGTADRHLCEAALKEMDSMDSNVQQITENIGRAMKYVQVSSNRIQREYLDLYAMFRWKVVEF
jgi:hypothetical protein